MRAVRTARSVSRRAMALVRRRSHERRTGIPARSEPLAHIYHSARTNSYLVISTLYRLENDITISCPPLRGRLRGTLPVGALRGREPRDGCPLALGQRASRPRSSPPTPAVSINHPAARQRSAVTGPSIEHQLGLVPRGRDRWMTIAQQGAGRVAADEDAQRGAAEHQAAAIHRRAGIDLERDPGLQGRVSPRE